MKPFRTHLQERRYSGISPDMTPCQILSQRNPPLAKSDFSPFKGISIYDMNDQLRIFIVDLKSWIMGQMNAPEQDMVADRIFNVVDGCPTRAGWTKYTGKVYRGLVKSDADMKANFKFERVVNVTMLGKPVLCAVGTYDYSPKRTAQSWSRKIDLASGFSVRAWENQSAIVLETDIRADGVRLDHLGGAMSEEEIILKPKSGRYRCYVLLHGRTSNRNYMSDFVWDLVPPEVRAIRYPS